MILAVDTETTGTDFFHGCRPFMITACDGKSNYVFEGRVDPYTRDVTWEQDEVNEFIDLVKSASKIIFHNAAFDIRALASIGIPPELFWDKLEDTLGASHCVCSGDTHNLKDLGVKYFNYSDDDEVVLEEQVKDAIKEARKAGYCVAKAGHHHFPGLRKNGTMFWKMDYWLAIDACRTYAVGDVERTLLLWDAFKTSIMVDGLWNVYQTRKKLIRIVYNIQTNGKSFDKEKAARLIAKFEKEMEEHRWNVKRLAKIDYRFNPNSRQHLVDLIHNRLKIPVEFQTKGKKPVPAMDQKALKSYSERYDAEPLVQLALYKKKQKHITDLTSYINWLDENNRTHSSLNITGTRETRQSSNSPNDQNTDKLLRSLFGPPPGYVWICTDMVNIELRIWAYSVGNVELIKAFEAGKSVHEMIMEIIFPEQMDAYRLAKSKSKSQLNELDQKALKVYQRVKNGNFSRIYGATDAKTNETYHGSKSTSLPNYCAKIDARFPGIKEFTDSRRKLAEECYVRHKTYAIHTLGGYRLDVPPDEPFKACNYFVQGAAGWIMTLAMINWDASPLYRKFNCQMNSQLHDGLDTEVKIVPALSLIIEAKCRAISEAGKSLIPTCDVTWELLYNPADETNTIVQEILQQHK
jgi:DNA polymerase I-like protein with 3'-5' exonuclease and polymerase domains